MNKKKSKIKNLMVKLIALIMMTSKIMIIIKILLMMMMNIEKLEALEHYLKNLIEIIINQ